MHSTVSRLKLFAFFVLLTALYFACTKITTTNIGFPFPPVDGVITKDTVLDIITKNKSFDTVTVGFSDDHVLGYINDPIFGKTTASVNFQVAPPTTPITFGAPKSDLIIDSVVLSLHYTGVWGDSTSHLFLHVYEMEPENKFTVDSTYKNTVSFEKVSSELTEGGIAKDISIQNINDVDTFKTYNEAVTNQVRIRLNASFGERLLNYDTSVVYASAATFNNYFKGFIVEPEQQNNSNALIKISLADTSTRLSLYYHFTDGASKIDTAVRRFTPSANSSASSNTIIRNYTTDLLNNFPSNAVQDSLIYIQTSPGTYAMLTIPHLDSLPNIIVHRAEILMQQVPDLNNLQDTVLTSPNLFLAALNPNLIRRFAVPYDVVFSSGTIANLTAFGVVPIKKTDNFSGRTISTYSFDISRYVQGVVTRSDSTYGFVLWAPYNGYIANVDTSSYTYPISSPVLNPVATGRVRLGGGNNTQYKMRLHIVYSKP